MPLYLIAYDLTYKPSSVYANLTKTLEEAGAHRAQESVWLHDSPYSALKNYEWLMPHFRQGDQLMITEIDLGNSVATKDSSSLEAIAAAKDNVKFTAAMEHLLRLAGVIK